MGTAILLGTRSKRKLIIVTIATSIEFVVQILQVPKRLVVRLVKHSVAVSATAKNVQIRSVATYREFYSIYWNVGIGCFTPNRLHLHACPRRTHVLACGN